MSKWNDPEKKQKAIVLNRQVFNTIDSYAREIDSTFDDVIKDDFKQFEELLIQRCATIQDMRMAAYEKARKEREEQKLADEAPLRVSGHEVEPIAI